MSDNEMIRMVLGYFGQEGGYEPGNFTFNMMRAYQGADPGNRARIRMGFPELADAMDVVMNNDQGIRELQARLVKREHPDARS